ncbi:MAG TPA: RNA methyltransferase [Dermatophilaceae bacterium]|nr:RNA methyltransferase [Dermatophilaceae bacterium]
MSTLTNPRSDRVKAVRALSRRSARERAGRFLAEGPQAVREAVRWAPGQVVDLYATTDATERHMEILAAARRAGIAAQEVTDDVLAAMCDTQTPQGLAAVCRMVQPALESVLSARPRLLVVLTQVRDPGNAGTVIRGADAAGADAVLVSTSSVDVHSPKVVRSTAGSLFHLPVVTGLDLGVLIPALRSAGIRLLAADGSGGRVLGDVDLSGPHAWVMGNEAWGLPQDLRDQCDEVVRVPIYGRAESLNLAMAATVCVYASAMAQRSG